MREDHVSHFQSAASTATKEACYRQVLTLLPYVLLLLIPGLALALKPDWDLAISSFFYDSGQGKFYLSYHPLVLAIYRAVPYITGAIVAVMTLLLLWQMLKRTSFPAFPKRYCVFVLVALILGPGLIVHNVFKDHFDRARPYQITEFGGDKQFTKALLIADQCERNCSFVSGHASVGFFFMVFALLFPRYRHPLAIFSLCFGLIIGAGRVLQGGHYASDVLFAGVVVWLTIFLLWEFLGNFCNKYQARAW